MSNNNHDNAIRIEVPCGDAFLEIKVAIPENIQEAAKTLQYLREMGTSEEDTSMILGEYFTEAARTLDGEPIKENMDDDLLNTIIDMGCYTEMATVGRDIHNNFIVVVTPDTGCNDAYFKVCNHQKFVSSTKVSRISFFRAKSFTHMVLEWDAPEDDESGEYINETPKSGPVRNVIEFTGRIAVHSLFRKALKEYRMNLSEADIVKIQQHIKNDPLCGNSIRELNHLKVRYVERPYGQKGGSGGMRVVFAEVDTMINQASDIKENIIWILFGYPKKQRDTYLSAGELKMITHAIVDLKERGMPNA